jgi:S1-C subfamily serine protease
VTLLDAVLLVAVALFGLSGYRQGLLVGVLSFVGFLAGGTVGMVITPSVVGDWAAGVSQVVVAVALVVALATVGQVVFSHAAAALRDRVTWRPARLLDSTAGALVSVCALLVVAWFVALAVRQAPLPELSRQVAGSRVLAAVDAVMPEQAGGLFRSFRALLGDSGLPQVFGGLSAERIAPVAPPSPDVATTPAVRAAAGSVVRIDGTATACRRSVEGSGFVYGPQRVLTNAHVVAGVTEPVVRVAGEGPALPAEVVVYDAGRDVAVLAVPGLRAPVLALDDGAERGDEAVVAGFPRGGPYRLDAARVRERITARGPDIYNARQVSREVLSLYTTIAPGNSGGPLLAPDGAVLGVVFAKSLDDPQTGYALTVAEVERVAAQGLRATEPADTQECAA